MADPKQSAPDFIPADPEFIPAEGPKSAPVEKIKSEQPGFLERAASGFGIPTSGEELGSTLSSIPGAGYLYNFGKNAINAGKKVYQEGKEVGQNLREGGPVLENIGKAGAGLLPGVEAISPIGGAVNKIGEDVQNKNYSGALGGATGVLASTALTGAGVGQAAEAPKMYTKPEAVERLNKAIDAPPKEMPRVRNILGDELNTVARTAKERNLPITNRADAANVSRIAAENDPYRKTFIEPNANLLARAPDETLQPVSKLDARLSKINEIRGKKQVMADTTPEKALELDAEANFLRDSIAEAVGKKMGIDPQIVRDARQHYGQIGELGDKFQLASDRSINPYGEEGPRGVTQIVPSILERYLYGPMADRATAKTFSRFKPEPANPLTFQPAEKTPVARPLPKIGEERPLFEVQDNSEASRQYLKEREAARQARKQEK